jgi:ankyrin repeat protein
MDAAERGEMMRIKQLLEDGQDINQVCQPSGSSALYVASRTNNLRLAEMLLEAGAEPGVLTDDLVSPCWIAISRGFDEMVKLLLEPRWNANLVEQIKRETTESLMQLENCGVQQTHYDLAVTRRYWKCVYHIESAIGVLPSATRIPEVLFEPPSGWAMGLSPAEPGQRPDMPMQFFYWEAFTKNGCREKPPPGSKKLVYKGQGIFEQESVVGED